jgi:hypothetical protein
MNTDSSTNKNSRTSIPVTFTESPTETLCINRVAPVTQHGNRLRLFYTLILVAMVLGVSRKSAKGATEGNSTDLSVLVIAAQTNDFSLGPIREALDFIGTPYHVHVATEAPGSLISDTLRSGTRGFYAGVILTSTSLGYTPDGGTTWLSALGTDEWSALEQYERDFGARRLNWYGFPGPNQGLNWASATVDTLANPITANWTAAAAEIFPYLNTSNSLTISNVWTYLATPLDTNTTVWLQDDAGNALLSTATLADGREVATMTFDSANYLVSSTVVRHGLINWVNGGLMLGQRHTYLSAQIDDVFLDDDIYTGGSYRQNSNDWHATITWQHNFNQRPSGTHFKYDMAYNGKGTIPGVYPGDDLTAYAAATEAEFKWISHTFTHPYLTYLTYDESMAQIVPNNQKAAELGLTLYSPANMVTPNITGLENPSFLNAAYDAGIRYLVTDTSIAKHRAPSPNAGIPNWFVPGILMIPRHANNLFYNVSTPTEWEIEYNDIFRAYWGRDLGYSEIIDNQSDLLLTALLKGDVSPQMFHQPNLRDYNGQGNTLLGDLLDAVADKYEFYYNFPFLSPTQDDLGKTVQARMDYNVSGVSATRHADGSVVVTVQNAAQIPFTGLRTANSEFYAGQWITFADLGAGQSVTFTPGTNGIYTAVTTSNTAPVATAANYTVAAGTPLPITLAGTDADNDILTFAVVGQPAIGQVTGVAPNVSFVPPLTNTGVATFEFTVSDGQSTSTATVTITVTENLNNAPVATDATHTTQANTPVTFHMTGTDVDGDELTFLIASQPAMGEVEFDEFVRSKVTYTPNTGMAGADSFFFTATDGQFTNTGKITINIEGVMNTGTNVTVTIDGNLAEWANVHSAGSGLDITNTAGNQIDLIDLKITHDADNLYIAYNNENAMILNWGYTLYIDTDRNPNTGFAMWQIGADIVIQGNGVFSYAGTGTDWNWNWVTAASATVVGNIAELALPRSAIGNPDNFHYSFTGDNSAFGGNVVEFIPASAVIGGRSYLRYNLVVDAGQSIQIDGNLADWAGTAPIATDDKDITGETNPLDLRELYLTNDTNNFYLAYVNEGPITLNWGYTLYLDTDANAGTGFRSWGVGAEFVIQGGEIFQYAGTGNDWAWTWVGSMEVVVEGNTAEAAFPKSLLGNTASTIRTIFDGNNAAFGGTGTDKVPNNLNNFLSYTIK